jgi:hypothetical protein
MKLEAVDSVRILMFQMPPFAPLSSSCFPKKTKVNNLKRKETSAAPLLIGNPMLPLFAEECSFDI